MKITKNMLEALVDQVKVPSSYSESFMEHNEKFMGHNESFISYPTIGGLNKEDYTKSIH